MWVNRNISGTVITPADTPRSYRIITPSGEIRRNRRDLNIDPQNHQPRESKEIPPPRSPIVTHSRSGTSILPPTRFTYGKGDAVCVILIMYAYAHARKTHVVLL